MPKLVEMFKVFRRDKKRGLDKSHSRSKGDNRSVLDADSFVFMPGGTEGQCIWENFQLGAGEAESRRKTHIGLVQSQETNGLQEVNLIISPSLQEKSDNLVLDGKVFNRRLSGTLVKARKSMDDLMEDEPIIRDYAFLLSTRERLSQELSGRYVYDRLIRPPLRPRDTPHQQKTQPANSQWKYPGSTGRTDGSKSPLLTDRRRKDDKDNVVLRGTGPRSSTPVKDNSLLRVNRGQLTCSVRDIHTRRDQKSLKRPVSGVTVDSGYSNLEFSQQSVAGSEYAMPSDAINWEGEEGMAGLLSMSRSEAFNKLLGEDASFKIFPARLRMYDEGCIGSVVVLV
jgi:hypothetical protein